MITIVCLFLGWWPGRIQQLLNVNRNQTYSNDVTLIRCHPEMHLGNSLSDKFKFICCEFLTANEKEIDVIQNAEI